VVAMSKDAWMQVQRYPDVTPLIFYLRSQLKANMHAVNVPSVKYPEEINMIA
jgi:hypothetical protein